MDFEIDKESVGDDIQFSSCLACGGKKMVWKINNAVVVPFDFSEHSRAALKRALCVAESAQQVHVLHVLPFLVPTEPGVVWATIDDAHRIEHALQNLRDALSDPEHAEVHFEVRIGDPGQVTVDRAEELGAELIVIGSHGRTGISRLFLGSVAERVVRLAHCPVLVEKLVPVAKKAKNTQESAQLVAAIA